MPKQWSVHAFLKEYRRLDVPPTMSRRFCLSTVPRDGPDD